MKELFRNKLLHNKQYQQGIELILAALQSEYGKIKEVSEPTGNKLEYKKLLEEIARFGNNKSSFPFLSSGAGQGALVELADGSIKWDLTPGAGILGYNHYEVNRAALNSAVSGNISQGEFTPGGELTHMSRSLVELAGFPFTSCRLSVDINMANDNALKVIREKQFPAYKMLAFENGFAGKSCAMQEITDIQGERPNQHVYGEVFYVPFYDPADFQSIDKSVAALKKHLRRYRGQIAGFVMELVQFRSGLNLAPKEFYIALIDVCREEGIAVWVNEQDSFARTEELFIFQKLGIAEQIDLVTCGDALNNGILLLTENYQPRAGVISEYKNGNTVAMRTGLRILELLKVESYFGTDGKIANLARVMEGRLEKLQKIFGKKIVTNFSVLGSVASVLLFEGDIKRTEDFLQIAFEKGLILSYSGGEKIKVQLLAPLILNEQDFEQVMLIFTDSLEELL